MLDPLAPEKILMVRTRRKVLDQAMNRRKVVKTPDQVKVLKLGVDNKGAPWNWGV